MFKSRACDLKPKYCLNYSDTRGVNRGKNEKNSVNFSRSKNNMYKGLEMKEKGILR